MTKMNYERASRQGMARRGVSVNSGARGTFGSAGDKRKKTKSRRTNNQELWCWGTKYRNLAVRDVPGNYLAWILRTQPKTNWEMRACASRELARRRNKSPVKTTKGAAN